MVPADVDAAETRSAAADEKACRADPGTPLAVEIHDVPVDTIEPNPRQPRTVFADTELDELAASIAEVGVLQPIVVRRHPSDDGRYELVMGERRWRASQLANRPTIPAIVRDTADDQLLRDALLENLQRVQLNPLEEAAAYEQMLRDFDCTHDELAAVVGKSRSHVTHMISLLRLPAPVQRRVAAGVLTAGHAKALLAVREPTACARLAERIVAEGLSVRATAELITLGDLPGWEEDHLAVRRRTRRPAQVPPDIAQAAEELSDQLDTRVRIEAGKHKGRIVVEFADSDDMQRILGMLTPRSQDATAAS